MVYIGVVSHMHSSILSGISCLPKLAKQDGVCIFVLDNVGENVLKDWCHKHEINYSVNRQVQGFGENNNQLFKTITLEDEFDLERDWFVVLNPDVDLTQKAFNVLCAHLNVEHQLYAIDLYKDEAGDISDDSIRNFPSFSDFVSSLLLGVNKTKVDKSLIKEPCSVDWAAGSFLVFKASHYQRLGGFDPAYFMYCEDIDICFRSATQFGCKVRYLPQVKARHLAQHGNRKIFSKHFYWHVSSTMRFLWRKFVYFYIKGKRV